MRHVKWSFPQYPHDWSAGLSESLLEQIEQRPADIIFTDACVDAWGAIHSRADGSIHVVASRWTPADHAAWNLSSSVASEPLAISRALCRLVAPATTASVIIYTDHEPLTAAVTADCSKAKAYSYWVLQISLRGLAIPCSIRTFLACSTLRTVSPAVTIWADRREVLERALGNHTKEDHSNDHTKERGLRGPARVAGVVLGEPMVVVVRRTAFAK